MSLSIEITARADSRIERSHPRARVVAFKRQLLIWFSIWVLDASISKVGGSWMGYRVIAVDYDGTLAHNGQVDRNTVQTLARVQESGRKLLMVTGRELESLRSVFPQLGLFDLIVAENGALLYHPSTGEERLLAKGPPAAFVEMLRRSGANSLSVGRCIVATLRPYEAAVYRAIDELGLNFHVILNRESVMILPVGVDKATGFRAAMAELQLPLDSAVGIGDAENDYAFLSLCGFSVAVANAIPSLKERVHLVTSSKDGAGVVEVLQRLLAAEDSFDVAHPAPR
jgi:hydroxymethylpyrimidine pyrophosphatase-like HAD family hydrolase